MNRSMESFTPLEWYDPNILCYSIQFGTDFCAMINTAGNEVNQNAGA